MPKAADRSTKPQPDELAKALRKAYPPTPEDQGEVDRFRRLIQALAEQAIGKVNGSRS